MLGMGPRTWLDLRVIIKGSLAHLGLPKPPFGQ